MARCAKHHALLGDSGVGTVFEVGSNQLRYIDQIGFRSQLPSPGMYLHATPRSEVSADRPRQVLQAIALCIGEYACSHVPFGQRSRFAWIAEISRPLPVPDLRHVFEVLA